MSPNPTGRFPRGITCSAGGRQVTLRGGLSSGTATIAVILGAAVGIGMLFAAFSPRPEAIPPAAPALLASVAVALVCWVGLQTLSGERLTVGEDEIVYERLLANVCWRRRTIARRNRIDLRMRAQGARRGVVLSAGSETLHIGRTLDPDGVEWLYNWLGARQGS
jgi:hypothetical protein